jgi:predicted nucleic acid-binding protein
MNGDKHPPSFVDTNIFVYAVADDEPVRTPVAQNLLAALVDDEALRLSSQVLQELYSILTGKVKRRLTVDQALAYLDGIARAPVVSPDYPLIRDAAQLSSRHTISFWDALIIVAAARSGADYLYSEDLQHGRTILGVKIVNPFRGK